MIYLRFLLLITLASFETSFTDGQNSTKQYEKDKEIQTNQNVNGDDKAWSIEMYGSQILKNYTEQRTEEVRTTTEQAFSTENFENKTDIIIFDEIGDSEAYREDLCLNFGKCVGKEHWYCNCDRLCEIYNDCCRDYVYRHNLTTEMEPAFKCLRLRTDIADYFWGVYAISTCPANYENSNETNRCLNGTLKEAGGPVIDGKHRTTLYRNKYCAICNDVMNFVDITVTFSPSPSLQTSPQLLFEMTTEELKEVLYDTSVYRMNVPEDIPMRYCVTDLLMNEDPICKLYLNPVYDKAQRVFYSNSFCISDEDLEGKMCLGDVTNYFPRPNAGTDDARLSIIFSFATIERLSEDQCDEYNQKTKTLRACDSLPLFRNSPFEIEYNIEAPGNATERELIQVGLISILNKNVLSFSKVIGTVTLSVNNDSTVMKVKSEGQIIKTAFKHELRNILRQLNDQQAVFTIFDEDTSKSVYKIGKPEQQPQEHDTFYRVLIKTRSLGVRSIEKYYRQYDVSVQIPQLTKLCRNALISAKRIDNVSLVVDSLKCQDVTHVTINHEVTVLSILTYSLCSCSSLALIVMIAVNRKRGLHFEIPISNLENLSLALVFANLLFIARSHVSKISSIVRLCQATSIVLHYAFLLVFSFASMSVIYIITTLFQIEARRFTHDESKTKKRIVITVIGLLIPLVFVASAFVVDRFGPPYFSPGYGNNDCFPTQFPGNFIFFTGPILLSIIINMICLLNIIRKIHTSKLSQGNIRQLSIFMQAKIFLRIFILTGFSWVTGMIAAYLESEWMEYVFTILCGSQGLLIVAANVTTRQLACKSCRKPQQVTLEKRSGSAKTKF